MLTDTPPRKASRTRFLESDIGWEPSTCEERESCRNRTLDRIGNGGWDSRSCEALVR